MTKNIAHSQQKLVQNKLRERVHKISKLISLPLRLVCSFFSLLFFLLLFNFFVFVQYVFFFNNDFQFEFLITVRFQRSLRGNLFQGREYTPRRNAKANINDNKKYYIIMLHTHVRCTAVYNHNEQQFQNRKKSKTKINKIKIQFCSHKESQENTAPIIFKSIHFTDFN